MKHCRSIHRPRRVHRNRRGPATPCTLRFVTVKACLLVAVQRVEDLLQSPAQRLEDERDRHLADLHNALQLACALLSTVN
jgi:hypothetical protein